MYEESMEMEPRYSSQRQPGLWKKTYFQKLTYLQWISFSFVFPFTLASHLRHRSDQMNNNLDAIYIIGMRQCQQRWNHVRTWALQESINVTAVYATRFDEINLHRPPIPIVGMPRDDMVSGGQVACTMSHIRAWRDAFRKNYSHVVVLEDDVQLKRQLIERLPSILRDAYFGSTKRNNKDWHFIFLRVHPTTVTDSREKWHGTLMRAVPGWGSAAYVLSGSGIRFLLTRITSYVFPLDVQLEKLQRGKDSSHAQFVVLDACLRSGDGKISPGCPENVIELPEELRGNCAHHGSQLGNQAKGKQMPGSV